MTTGNEIRVTVTGQNNVQQSLTQATQQVQQFGTQQQRLFEQMRANMARSGQQAGQQFGANLVAGASQNTAQLTANQQATLNRIRADYARQGQQAGQEFIQRVTGGADPSRLTAQQANELRRIENDYTRAGNQAGSDFARQVATSSNSNQLTHAQQQQLDQIRARYERTAKEAGHILTTVIASSTDPKPLENKLAEAGKAAGDKMAEETKKGMGSKLMDGMKSTGAKAGELAKTAVMAVGAAILAGVAALGVMAGIALHKSIEKAIGNQDDNAKLAAQLGLNKAQGNRANANSQAVYAGNYGESISNVDEALKGVSNNIVDLRTVGDASLQSMAKNALNLASAFDVDLNDSTKAVGQMLKTGLAKNADEAFDIVTKGFTSGVDKAGDFLDTLNEYGTQFRKLGIDGATATGLLSQGLKAGARDADLVADAFKEFSIRAIDGSKTTSQGFKDLGLDADKMAEKIGHGGKDAAAATQLVLDKLRNMKDPVKQAGTATELFGTQAEDLGQALFKLDPSHAVDALGQVKGAAEGLDSTLGSTLSGKLEALKRTVEVQMIGIGNGIISMFNEVAKSDAVKDFSKQLDKAADMPIFKELVSWFTYEARPAIIEFFKALIEHGANALKGLQSAVGDNMPQLEEFGRFLWNGAKMIMDLLAPALGVLINAFTGVVTAIGVLIRAYDFVRIQGINLVRSVIDTFGNILDAATYGLSWVPGLGPKLKQAQGEFRKFKDQTVADLDKIAVEAQALPDPVIRPRVDASRAYAQLNALRGQLNDIQMMSAGRYAFGLAHGGVVGAATGGVHGGMRLVGEQGPELVSLPYGSTVHPANTTRNMMSGGSGGGGDVRVWLDTSGLTDSEFARIMRKIVRIEGAGDVQVALGTG
jgi:phage-related minor tail protein